MRRGGVFWGGGGFCGEGKGGGVGKRGGWAGGWGGGGGGVTKNKAKQDFWGVPPRSYPLFGEVIRRGAGSTPYLYFLCVFL